jgi:hypothetical protein
MPTPTNAIWPALPPALANEILCSVQKSNKKLYRTALDIMAPRMGIRVPTLLEQPKAERHATWARILAHPQMEVLSFNLISTWLIETQTPMLCAWLDSLGIAHGENGCADDFPPAPSKEKLQAGIDTLLAKFDPTLVSIYLRAFNQIDETQWADLDEILKSDSRLKLVVSVPAPAAA